MKIPRSIPLTVAGLAVLVGLFAVMGAAGIATWEYTNSDGFCANACHDVHPENAFAHHASQHANVACVECHIGRMSTFPAMLEKAGHVSHAWSRIVGYDRPLTAPSLPASERSCEGCHTAQPHRHNSLRIKRHFAADEQNTETTTALVVRAIGRGMQDDGRRGIAVHSRLQVRFIATDPQKRSIPWVEVTRPGGSVTVYQDPAEKLDPEMIRDSAKRVLECADCHNLAGHPVRSPDDLVDEAIADGTLDARFPYIKARAVELLNQPFRNRAEAMTLLSEARARYRADYPDLPERFPQDWEESQEFLEERQDQMAAMLLRNQFDAADISWRSFPDHSEHRNSPGCFRCHNGRHQSEDGRLIPVSCTTCHGIPVVTARRTIPLQLLDLTNVPRPDSHKVQDFVFRHADMAFEDDADCEGCHGEIDFGDDNGSFCSNSGCHDARLPGFGPL